MYTTGHRGPVYDFEGPWQQDGLLLFSTLEVEDTRFDQGPGILQLMVASLLASQLLTRSSSAARACSFNSVSGFRNVCTYVHWLRLRRYADAVHPQRSIEPLSASFPTCGAW